MIFQRSFTSRVKNCAHAGLFSPWLYHLTGPDFAYGSGQNLLAAGRSALHYSFTPKSGFKKHNRKVRTSGDLSPLLAEFPKVPVLTRQQPSER